MLFPLFRDGQSGPALGAALRVVKPSILLLEGVDLTALGQRSH
jgi:hypothetical protein